MAEIGPSQAGKSSAAPQQAAAGSHFAVVALGASAGGLEAFGRILDHLASETGMDLASETGMAFILVQHLDPTHQSLMVELLARHTAIPVIEASHGMMLEPDHVYVIPPGRYLAVDHDMLRVTQPIERHGMRLPFDFLLHSIAESCGARAIVVVLSLCLERVTKQFGDKTAVDGISFTVAAGSVFGFLGSNGAGFVSVGTGL
ncbi:chemotaxis protein CheB [Acidiphilium sp. 34-64-41]|uniref:chemotaxis protein CheB n=1 Tax=Acidiphilium sp. 34-64-41 TaxID=1970297 RepID=UPI000BC6E0F2|nr:chemotaxis protein CheB [Acidiphilium sp. 34-64-41]OZB26659.1 MAG: hypothetical protein B7X49_12370 [Acidiphilium sp. 34-64-41]